MEKPGVGEKLLSEGSCAHYILNCEQEELAVGLVRILRSTIIAITTILIVTTITNY